MPAENEFLPTFSEVYRQQPLLFIPNQGQADANVSFIAQKLGYYVGISAQEVSMTLFRPHESSTALHLVWKFVGASGDAIVEGLDQEAGSFHYFIGPRSTCRFMNLTPYRKVICRELWAGIDVLIQEQDQSLAFEWIIRPNGRPEDIRFTCEGCHDIHLNEAGDLIIDTGLGVLVDAKPVAYQAKQSEVLPIICRYELQCESCGANKVGFVLPEGYDRELDLIIR
ncbi:hypothetical protein [Cohnella mopanensis]|uniref:DUF7948 domain-containing protein n=1 Tax=Cohnella mopanensis TaxID=2911966 RepID=UPI001EF8F7EB|nr:hypothetical protein [Cohnella mopanensis]